MYLSVSRRFRFLISLATLLAISPILAQPSNDDCANAIPMPVFVDLGFTTNGATTDGPIHPDEDCFFNGTDSIHADIWYTFTAIADGPLEWTTCGTVDFDTRLAVYATDEACLASAENLVACNDDADGCANFSSELSFFGEEGETYVLRLGSWGDENAQFETGSGTSRLRVIVGPTNDNCANATEVELGTTIFTNIFATDDGPEHPGMPCGDTLPLEIEADIWYRFLAPYTGTLIWETCGLADFDTDLAVYPAGVCPPTAESLIACNDFIEGCSDFTSRLDLDIVEGESYLLRLGGYQGATGDGSFNLIGLDVGIEENGDNPEIRLYPNPVLDQLMLNLGSKAGNNWRYRIMDSSGWSTATGDLTIGFNSLNISKLPAGIYLIFLSGPNGEVAANKFVKSGQ